VRAKLEVLFDKEPNDHIDPDIAVAYGATTVAH
jgi:molecular chaperone DnaK (HSP70)